MQQFHKLFMIGLSGLCSHAALAQNNVDAYAVSKTDTRISAWATACTVTRGWVDIADHSQGLASFGVDANGVGIPGSSTDVVSLGDSGTAVLTFANPIKNMSGPDFAVFENGFVDGQNPQQAFLEFAFVEVSSDGQRYVRFPASYTGSTATQYGNWTYVDGREYKNLAGRYVLGYGTPFDLEELQDSTGLDINNITHVRLVDVIGSVNPLLGSKDAQGNLINDPYPSPYASGGFDLSGIAVLNNRTNSIADRMNKNEVQIVPNPANQFISLSSEKNTIFYYRIVNVLGQEIKSGTVKNNVYIDVSGLTAGSYYIFTESNGTKSAAHFLKH
ncbi:secretion protein [Taibaiella sp. KBW10]|uniref:T9SS type A sorting domain-containing protein n=1 Tax=Taibaiella sp. KBW10 TaxID=2153357 RepID=UPI000F592271|nr:T9SS type A sorting domain-containing protein [Taibaiella sp. KBW10]RQO32502.1 secretion protein [Taibaiella sp. KBW10]